MVDDVAQISAYEDAVIAVHSKRIAMGEREV